MRLLAVMLAGLCGCAGWATQVKGDLESVLPQCSTEAVITLCQCAARVERDRQCVRLRSEGKTGTALPPACREEPASQPHATSFVR